MGLGGALKSIQRRNNYRLGKKLENSFDGCMGGCLSLPFLPFIWFFKMCAGFYDKWRDSALFGFQDDDIPKSYSVLFKQLAKSIGIYSLIIVSYLCIGWGVRQVDETNETAYMILGILAIPIIILGIAIGIGFVAILFSFIVVIFKKLFKQ
tara:strand:+ start:167 stop:619 length:453 start_codon:yes stop_codon:yes gene_type:complete